MLVVKSLLGCFRRQCMDDTIGTVFGKRATIICLLSWRQSERQKMSADDTIADLFKDDVAEMLEEVGIKKSHSDYEVVFAWIDTEHHMELEAINDVVRDRIYSTLEKISKGDINNEFMLDLRKSYG